MKILFKESDDLETKKLPREILKEIQKNKEINDLEILERRKEKLESELKKARQNLKKNQDALLDSLSGVKKDIKKIIKKELNKDQIDNEDIKDLLGNYIEYFDEMVFIQKKYMKLLKDKNPMYNLEIFKRGFSKNFDSRLIEIDKEGRHKNVNLEELKKKHKIKNPKLINLIINEINKERMILKKFEELNKEVLTLEVKLNKINDELNILKGTLKHV